MQGSFTFIIEGLVSASHINVIASGALAVTHVDVITSGTFTIAHINIITGGAFCIVQALCGSSVGLACSHSHKKYANSQKCHYSFHNHLGYKGYGFPLFSRPKYCDAAEKRIREAPQIAIGMGL